MAEHDKENLKKSADYSGDPWRPTNVYFKNAEAGMEHRWTQHIWPLISKCDFSFVFDLAAGHGRNSAKLAPLAAKLVIQDIQPGNIDICRDRFRGAANIEFMVGNGYDFQPIEDSCISLMYCFDAMVHFNPDVVRSYLFDTVRVLRPGGQGFFHHSNYTGGKDWRGNPAARNYMSANLFSDLCGEAGLRVLNQKIIDWGSHKNLDCLTMVERSID
ncbi:MAG: class I SAM-dependent methyltransferase [Haliea sp.]|nr:class I SAM-dependent methyltransferase [Haliea sp.]